MLMRGGGNAFVAGATLLRVQRNGDGQGYAQGGGWSPGRANAGEAHASGRANRPYAVRERAGGWEMLPDSAVALGVGPDWDTERRGR
jgi:hypothetical protein